jgi:hypothetical protein
MNLYFVTCTEDGEMLGYRYNGGNKRAVKILQEAYKETMRTETDENRQGKTDAPLDLFFSNLLRYLELRYMKEDFEESDLYEKDIKQIIPDFPFEWSKKDWEGFESFDPLSRPVEGHVTFYRSFV